MTNLSLRGRLTITIVALTGVLSALAVLLGTQLLRDGIAQSTVDEQLAAYTEFAAPFDDDGLVVDEGVVEGFFPEEFEFFIDDAIEADLAAFNQFEAEYAAAVVDQLGLYPRLAEEFGDDEGSVLLLLSSGDIARLDDRAQVQVPVEPTTDLLVVAASITEIGDGFFEGFDPDDAVDRTFEVGSAQVADDITIGVVAEITDEFDALDEVNGALWFSAAALTVLAGVAAWFLIGRALKPVGAITTRVSEITAGSLDERVPEPRRQDEIGRLAATMNTMLGRLETSDLRRRQFISDASHELRTPVAVLRSEAEVARRAPASTSVEELGGVVLGEAQRLETMVDDLLAIARSDERRSTGDASRVVDVDDIVLAESERSRAVPIDRSAVSAGRIHGTADDVSRIVAHLLDNAARHASSSVAIGVRTDNGAVHCWVDDDGPGIPLPDRARVLERFVRLDDARSRDRGGAGLGLAVVATTTERMGGTVEITDAPLGGARVALSWPAAEHD